MGQFELGWQLMLLFAISVGASYLAHRGLQLLRRPLRLPEGSLLRMRGPLGMYRTRTIRATSSGWQITAPLQRDVHVPLRPGEALTVDACTPQGVLRFDTQIVHRDSQSHTLEILRPKSWRLIERRGEKRYTEFEGDEALIDDRPAILVDLSSQGAKAVVPGGMARGERVSLRLPGERETIGAWILDTEPAAFRSRLGTAVRLRFEDTFEPQRVR